MLLLTRGTDQTVLNFSNQLAAQVNRIPSPHASYSTDDGVWIHVEVAVRMWWIMSGYLSSWLLMLLVWIYSWCAVVHGCLLEKVSPTASGALTNTQVSIAWYIGSYNTCTHGHTCTYTCLYSLLYWKLQHMDMHIGLLQAWSTMHVIIVDNDGPLSSAEYYMYILISLWNVRTLNSHVCTWMHGHVCM